MLIFGDGTQTRDFRYVEDTARGIFGGFPSCDWPNIDLGAGIGRINELAKLVADVTGHTGAKTTLPSS